MKAKSLPFGSYEGAKAWRITASIGTHIYYTQSDEEYAKFTNDLESCEDCLGTGYEDGMTIRDYEKYGKGKERKPCLNCVGTGDVFWYHNKSNKLEDSKLPF